MAKRSVWALLPWVLYSAAVCPAQPEEPVHERPSGVRGTVVYSVDNMPIRNAYVVARRDGSPTVEVSRGDKDGKYSVELPPAIYDVCVMALAFSPTCLKIEVTPDGMMVFNAALKANTLGEQVTVCAGGVIAFRPDSPASLNTGCGLSEVPTFVAELPFELLPFVLEDTSNGRGPELGLVTLPDDALRSYPQSSGAPKVRISFPQGHFEKASMTFGLHHKEGGYSKVYGHTMPRGATFFEMAAPSLRQMALSKWSYQILGKTQLFQAIRRLRLCFL